MKKFFVLMLWVCSAVAAPVSIDLQNVPLKDLIRLVYGEILGQNYVIDGNIQDDLRPVSLVLKSVESDQAEKVLRGLLESQDVIISKSAGVVVLRHGRPEEKPKELFVYKPRYRSVTYLTDLLQTLFPQGSFMSQRGGGQSIASVMGDGLAANVSGMSTGVVAGNGSTARGGAANGYAGATMTAGQGLNKSLDVEADTLIFQGSKRDVEKLKDLLAELDQSTGEVMVKAVIYEVQSSRKEGSAIDLALSILASKVGINITGGADSSKGVFVKWSTDALNVDGVFSALTSDDRFKVVSSPRVRVRSGSSAHFAVGDETPILGSVSYDADGKPIQSVSYKSSGVIFDIKPEVRESGVDLHLNQQISSFVQTTTGVNGTPTLTKRELSTDLTVADDEIIVIGGLEGQKTENTNSGLSFLPALFQSNTNSDSKTEIVVMLHLQRV